MARPRKRDDDGPEELGEDPRLLVLRLLCAFALGANNIANEVDRYIVWPGQALAYKVGQLEILRLRADAKARLDGAFDIKAFHDVVLGSGAVSLPVLRSLVNDWLGTLAPTS